MYKKVLLSILWNNSFVNTKTNSAEKTRNVKLIGAEFWLKLKSKNIY